MLIVVVVIEVFWLSEVEVEVEVDARVRSYVRGKLQLTKWQRCTLACDCRGKVCVVVSGVKSSKFKFSRR